ncbi:hypothetical protein ACRE_031440 [Hapsidospora chrysogenum ATCC 11550]|uniref:Uncharacterized protein n=1 Tax=Hapsidospora chrysogenum (strain ATCC 11550 / CBS 779.69 / DSM 880 / IAM 14645 / JCM 23072 / IMI 49137) TaxID=857340 RepID=A0A086T9G9_HAPC1|nr:hypothetical protein ACRE_031440 [Hapsidospora chrysogenum ATCC 11550]
MTKGDNCTIARITIPLLNIGPPPTRIHCLHPTTICAAGCSAATTPKLGLRPGSERENYVMTTALDPNLLGTKANKKCNRCWRSIKKVSVTWHCDKSLDPELRAK